jgi:hypothetical protein
MVLCALIASGMRDRAAVQQLAGALGPAVAGKAVVDATNPLSPYPGLEVLWDGTSGEVHCWQQQQQQQKLT